MSANTDASRRPYVGLEEALRAAVRDSGLSLAEVGRRSGVNAAQLSRLVLGTRGLTLRTAERLARRVGLTMTLKPPP